MKQYKDLFYPETAFGGFTDIDGTIAFYVRVNALLLPSFTVVDFGCGRGEHQEDTIDFRRRLRCIKGKVSKVIGADVTDVGKHNGTIDEFRSLAGPAWPFSDGSVNMILCDWVIEHLPEPGEFFREAKRILAPGGYVCIRTTNIHSYVGLASKIVPNKHHSAVLSKVQTGRKEEDVFPTRYRCNTIAAMRRLFSSNGFSAAVYGHEAEPSYLSFSRLAYALGVVHQKVAPRSMKGVIFAFGQA
jgi:SAM-dependent methyltransferase